MFIKVEKSGYDRDSQQFCRGLFLMLVQREDLPVGQTVNKIRGIVRHTVFSPCGNFMMGFARVKGKRLTLSGSYGSDGLPMSVATEIYDLGVDLPDDLYEAWSHGGGWNGAGNEAPLMRKWALEVVLPKTYKKRSKH